MTSSSSRRSRRQGRRERPRQRAPGALWARFRLGQDGPGLGLSVKPRQTDAADRFVAREANGHNAEGFSRQRQSIEESPRCRTFLVMVRIVARTSRLYRPRPRARPRRLLKLLRWPADIVRFYRGGLSLISNSAESEPTGKFGHCLLEEAPQPRRPDSAESHPSPANLQDHVSWARNVLTVEHT